MDSFSIKFNNGQTSFEVQGPTEDWVDRKVEELKPLLALAAAPADSGATDSSVRQAKPAAPKKQSPRSASKKSAGVNSELSDKFNETLAQQINSYVDVRRTAFDKTVTKQAAILAVFLKDELGIEAVDYPDLEYIYRKLGWKTVNHEAQLMNARIRDKYFAQSGGKLELTHAGIVFGRDTSKD
jgi:hypothetical protein